MIFVIEIMVSLVVLVSDTYEIRLLESIMNYDYDYYTALSLAEINDTWQSIIIIILIKKMANLKTRLMLRRN